MTTNFRALCAELYQCLEYIDRTCDVPIPGMLLDSARTALAHPEPPDEPVSAAYTLEPPADGEVAETVKWLREEAQISWADSCPVAAGRLTRAADLLERLAEPSSPAGGVE